MATVVPISLTIGANRIIPGVGIPYPLGDPTQGEVDSKNIRRKMVKKSSKKCYKHLLLDKQFFEKDWFLIQ